MIDIENKISKYIYLAVSIDTWHCHMGKCEHTRNCFENIHFKLFASNHRTSISIGNLSMQILINGNIQNYFQ